MNPTEFEQFLKFAADQLSDKSDSQKIQAFIAWCKKIWHGRGHFQAKF